MLKFVQLATHSTLVSRSSLTLQDESNDSTSDLASKQKNNLPAKGFKLSIFGELFFILEEKIRRR